MGKQSFKVDTSNNTNTDDNCTALTQHSAIIKQGGGRGVVHPASDLPPTYTDAEERHKNTKDILVAGFGGGVENQAFEDDATAKKKPRDTNDAVVGDLPEHTEEEEKQQWARPIEFLLSCIAMSVGLGNVWRFPKTAYDNGGGAFLIPYLFILTFIGRPLYFMELSMGQFSSYGGVKMWKVVPAAKGVGYGQMIATWSVVTYYCAIMGMTVFYFLMSFNKVLPWSFCDYDSWADENCVDAAGNFSFSNESESSSEQYF
ncbi:sodium-dependent nutrient amino acid transporter 1-like isoform X2 [Homarus americanus]|uniref:sodium-dependent nutrient amino acid transporter 1-like isoform X2 n=1 Tax=Homarus americanus TaxID=6706 RepID=UPI001C44C6AA|nr:sodium-dependent nutrient amino acid transporter 1-like isoform X2 [Homarus americanus]